jgi:hypothetical protein
VRACERVVSGAHGRDNVAKEEARDPAEERIVCLYEPTLMVTNVAPQEPEFTHHKKSINPSRR